MDFSYTNLFRRQKIFTFKYQWTKLKRSVVKIYVHKEQASGLCLQSFRFKIQMAILLFHSLAFPQTVFHVT